MKPVKSAKASEVQNNCYLAYQKHNPYASDSCRIIVGRLVNLSIGADSLYYINGNIIDATRTLPGQIFVSFADACFQLTEDEYLEHIVKDQI